MKSWEKFKPGDRVIDNHLGKGEILRWFLPKYFGLVIVQFDVTPPIQYNMGENPCAVFASPLRLETPAS